MLIIITTDFHIRTEQNGFEKPHKNRHTQVLNTFFWFVYKLTIEYFKSHDQLIKHVILLVIMHNPKLLFKRQEKVSSIVVGDLTEVLIMCLYL
jgi:hypothetical protein